jgi:hypothetical protein
MERFESKLKLESYSDARSRRGLHNVRIQALAVLP